jgi:hypothetical protein
MLLPRSAIYVSIVMVTVILALVAWLILDTMSQRPGIAPRFQHGYAPSLSTEAVALARSVDDLSTLVQPGLSPSGARWNE